MKRDQLNDTYLDLIEKQRLYFKTVKDFKEVSFTTWFLSPAFSKKSGGHSFRHSVSPSVRPSVRPSFRPPNIVGTLCVQLLLQFYADSFETLQMFLPWSEDMHVVWILS